MTLYSEFGSIQIIAPAVSIASPDVKINGEKVLTASGNNSSFQFGPSSSAGADFSFAFGDYARTYGSGAAAFGTSTYARGKSSFSAGMDTQAWGDYSATFGVGTLASNFGSFAVGIGNSALDEDDQWINNNEAVVQSDLIRSNPAFSVGIAEPNPQGGFPGGRRSGLVTYFSGKTRLEHYLYNPNDTATYFNPTLEVCGSALMEGKLETSGLKVNAPDPIAFTSEGFTVESEEQVDIDSSTKITFGAPEIEMWGVVAFKEGISGTIRIEPQGDVDMGRFTVEPAP